VLRTEGLTIRFGGLDRGFNNVNLDIRRGEIADHRAERRGQEPLLQLRHRRAGPTSAASCSTERHTGRPPTLISRSGIALPIQITNILPNATTLETSASPHNRAATLEHAPPTTTASATSSRRRRQHWRRSASPARADELAPICARRAAQPGIGIALATEPDFVPDEPTAGHERRPRPTTRFQLVRKIAKDLTILIVEHDMPLVMDWPIG